MIQFLCKNNIFVFISTVAATESNHDYEKSLWSFILVVPV
jgi:hypothetical protein